MHSAHFLWIVYFVEWIWVYSKNWCCSAAILRVWVCKPIILCVIEIVNVWCQCSFWHEMFKWTDKPNQLSAINYEICCKRMRLQARFIVSTSSVFDFRFLQNRIPLLHLFARSLFSLCHTWNIVSIPSVIFLSLQWNTFSNKQNNNNDKDTHTHILCTWIIFICQVHFAFCANHTKLLYSFISPTKHTHTQNGALTLSIRRRCCMFLPALAILQPSSECARLFFLWFS